MESYYCLYLPGIIILLIPVIISVIKGAAKRYHERKREQARRIALDEKTRVSRLRRQVKRERKESDLAAASVRPRRDPGRPRRDPEPRQVKTILSAPDSADPSVLPTSCTPEEFAAWVEKIF